MENRSDLWYTSVQNTTVSINSTENSFQRPVWPLYVELTYLGIVAVLGVPGNSLLVLVQARIVDKASTDYFVIAMAITDLVCAGFSAPIRMLITDNVVWEDIVSPTLCAIRAFVLYFVTMSSAFLLAAIAIDRYIHTCHPFYRKYGIHTAKKVCCCIGISGVVCGFPNLFISTVDDRLQCHFKPNSLRFKQLWDYAMTGLTMVTFIIIAFAYLNISVHIRLRHQRRMNKLLHAAPKDAEKSTSCWWLKGTKVLPESGMSKESVPTGTTSLVDKQLNTEQPSTELTKGSNSMQYTDTSGNTSASNTMVGVRRLARESKINRTTRTMFVITMVYLLLWMTTWVRIVSKNSVTGSAFHTFSRSFYMLSCFINPLIFISMSTKFREKSKQMFLKK